MKQHGLDTVSNLKRYQKKAASSVTAVRLDLETSGFTYEKWGASQQCKPGDWIVDNNGDVYTIDGDVFSRTYRHVERGQYVKSTPVYAERAEDDGSIKTKEGTTHYKAGDYLVYNDRDQEDGYAVSAKKFEEMYDALDD